jgi:hypothetical protein
MSASSYVLLIESPDRKFQARELAKPKALIGREEGDVVLHDTRCSSRHAEILFDGKGLRLRDLESTNGTWQAGQRITEAPWTRGTTFQIGMYRLTLQEVRTEAGRGLTVAMSGPPPALTSLAPSLPAPAPDRPAQALLAHARRVPLWLRLGLPVLLLGAAGAAVHGWQHEQAPVVVNLPLMTEPRESRVQFVWFSGTPGAEVTGGTSPARIRVAPNTTGTVSVGVAEEYARGSGDQWRTATWLAAFNATRAMGTSLASYEFNVHVGGHVDGPSAGLLTTVAMLALMRGKPMRSDTTMTGTINPDGTAGPVGGIVQKMQGAKNSGLLRFGFPVGTRQHRDLADNRDVDLMVEAQRLGLEALELSDLYQAYEFATGDTLPRRQPAADAALEPSERAQALLRAKVLTWKTRVEREYRKLQTEKQHFKASVPLLVDLNKQAEKAYQTAQRDERNGYAMPALSGFAQAAVSIALVMHAGRALELLSHHDMNGLLQALETARSVRPELDAFGQQLDAQAAFRTRGGQLSSAAAYTLYVEARAAMLMADEYWEQAQAQLAQLKNGAGRSQDKNNDAMLSTLVGPTLFYELADEYFNYAKDVRDLVVDEGESPPLAPEVIDRVVAGYAAAASAVLACFDALVIADHAASQKIPIERARQWMKQNEMDYALALNSVDLAESSGSGEQPEGAKLMRLAAASVAFFKGATLINKWYSLGAHERDGETVIENRRALSAQLDLARRNAQEAAGHAQAEAGFIPTAARLNYQLAGARREGSDQEKLEALQAYWEAAFWSELAAGTR